MSRKHQIRIEIEIIKSQMDGNTDWGGEIRVCKEKKVVCVLGFTVNDQQIYVDTLNTESGYQHIGYGSIAMDIMKGFARFLEIPIILYSIHNSYPFYEKMGFMSCRNKKMKRRLIQLKKDADAPDELDLIWLPECLVDKKKIVIDI
jgi:hypothetical protein